MYEGSATSRGIQIFSGILLGLLTGLCLFIGLVTLYAIIFHSNYETITFVISIIFIPIGLVGLLMAKRLITAMGASKGAGLLSPNEYRFVGYFFSAISIFILLNGILNSTMKLIFLSPSPLLLTYFCFVAARFREGMKNAPKWKNLRANSTDVKNCKAG